MLKSFKLYEFPDPECADSQGIIAAGGKLNTDLLLSAYSSGIFPWYSDGQPVLWWSPDPRFVLFPSSLHVSKTFRKILRKNTFRITVDTAFYEVIENCRKVKRNGQSGTWITREMLKAYTALHEAGFAHSVEVYSGGKLAGGLYGVSLGSVFFGESMFSLEENASRAGFIKLALFLKQKNFSMYDCQVYTEYLAGMGAEEISRKSFLELLKKGLKADTYTGKWTDTFPDFENFVFTEYL
jgi:leucyl/phenylalanyl-tRNA--protein transferase